MRKPKPETAEQRVERGQQQIVALCARRDATADPLERGRLSLDVQQRTAGLTIFQRSMQAPDSAYTGAYTP